MLKWLFALLLPLMSLPALANAENTKDLLNLEAHAYRLTADISILALQEGGRRYEQRLDQTIHSGNQLADKLRSRWPGVARQWQISAEFMQEKRGVAAANSDVSLTNDLEAVQNKLYEKIQQAKAELTTENLAASDTAALVALIALEHMVAEYMYYNINVFGGHAITNSNMQDNAVRFKQSVTSIESKADVSKRILAKWRFIEKPLLDYNQQSATFIVMKTTDNIRKLLLGSLHKQM